MLCHQYHSLSVEEWAVRRRMLSHSLLTPISAQQDEAPVAPGLCRVSFIHPAPTPSLFASFSLCSDKVIDGLSTLTMQAHFIVSAARPSFASSLVVLAPFTPVNNLITVRFWLWTDLHVNYWNLSVGRLSIGLKTQKVSEAAAFMGELPFDCCFNIDLCL